MKKREFLEKIAGLGDDEDIVLTLTYPKEDDGFTMGEGEDDSADNSQVDDSEDEDDGALDNEDGTATEFYPEYDVDVVEMDDEETGGKKNVAFVNLDLGDDDDEDDSDEDDSPSDDD